MFENLEKNLYEQYIKKPADLEDEINSISKIAARELLYKGRASFIFLEEEYLARGVIRDKHIIVAVSNETHRRAAIGDYVPYTIDCDIDNNFTMVENYRAIFAGFLRHVAGIIEPEEIE